MKNVLKKLLVSPRECEKCARVIVYIKYRSNMSKIYTDFSKMFYCQSGMSDKYEGELANFCKRHLPI